MQDDTQGQGAPAGVPPMGGAPVAGPAVPTGAPAPVTTSEPVPAPVSEVPQAPAETPMPAVGSTPDAGQGNPGGMPPAPTPTV